MARKNILKKIITVMIVFAVMTPFMASTAFAATNVNISGDDEVDVNSEFTVHIEFSGDNTMMVDGQIGYDAAKLEYVSGAKDGGEGYVILKKGGGEGSVAFDVTFRAIKGGKTGLDVSSSEIIDTNKNPLENCAVTKVIQINGDSTNQDNENVVQEEKAPQPTAEDKAPGSDSIIFIILGVVLVAAIVIIIVVLRRKGKGKSN